MQTFRQYRMKKKIAKLLNAPVPEEESYTPSPNLYPTNKSLHISDGSLDSAEELRLTVVERIANLLISQVDRVRRWEQDDDTESRLVRQRLIEDAFREIDVHFEEFDSGLVLSETERTERKHSQVSSFAEGADQPADTAQLEPLEARVAAWQQEKRRRANKLHRLERSIHQLSLNVHDSRCRRIMADRTSLVEALNKCVDSGVVVLRDVHRKVQVAYGECLTT